MQILSIALFIQITKMTLTQFLDDFQDKILKKQAEAEVVPSSSLVEVKVGVEVEVGIEVGA